MAQFEFQYTIKQWEGKGVNFRMYIYVPEIHPDSKDYFCEREDEAHVLKVCIIMSCRYNFKYSTEYFQRIANHTRSGGPENLQLERYVEALQDPASSLTLPVLTGTRKQSVIDAERLFSPDLAQFMKSKGYEFEARYIETIWNWRRSCDERGLSELERSRFNYNFLNLVLDELMPWHRDLYDFLYLEVNRCKNVVY